MQRSCERVKFILNNSEDEDFDICTFIQAYIRAYNDFGDSDYFIVADMLLDELIKEEIERSNKHGK
ncbi:hypothetical protein CYK87_09350 [Clostridium perfringens]|nr:hypothetical protein CYK87_09350 [Clostridium perfringens]